MYRRSKVVGMANRRGRVRGVGARYQAKTEAGSKACFDGLRKRHHDDTPDEGYLEVVEEILRQRENNGRDREEAAGAVNNND